MKKLVFTLMVVWFSFVYGFEWSIPINLSKTLPAIDHLEIAFNGSVSSAIWHDQAGQEIQVTNSVDAGVTWSSPKNLIENDGSSAKIALQYANVVLIWPYQVSSKNKIQEMHSRDCGKVWSSPTDLSPLYFTSLEPEIGMSGDHLVSLWKDQKGRVEASYSMNRGLTWSPRFYLSDGIVTSPKIVLDGQRAVALWINEVNGEIQETHSEDGGVTWSHNQVIVNAGNFPQFLNLVLQGDDIIAIWARSNGTINIVETVLSHDGGKSWADPKSISSTLYNSEHPRVVLNGNHAIATWDASIGNYTVVQVTFSYDKGDHWVVPNLISSNSNDTYSSEPQIAMNDQFVVIAWHGQIGTTDFVQASYSTDFGASWSYPYTFPGNKNSEPHLVLSKRQAILIWKNSNDNQIVQSSYAILKAPGEEIGYSPAVFQKDLMKNLNPQSKRAPFSGPK